MESAKTRNGIASFMLLIAVVLIMAIGLAHGARENVQSRNNEGAACVVWCGALNEAGEGGIYMDK